MKCHTDKIYPACYAISPMCLVRAKFLKHTKQFDRLEAHRKKWYERGVHINHHQHGGMYISQ